MPFMEECIEKVLIGSSDKYYIWFIHSENIDLDLMTDIIMELPSEVRKEYISQQMKYQKMLH